MKIVRTKHGCVFCIKIQYFNMATHTREGFLLILFTSCFCIMIFLHTVIAEESDVKDVQQNTEESDVKDVGQNTEEPDVKVVRQNTEEFSIQMEVTNTDQGKLDASSPTKEMYHSVEELTDTNLKSKERDHSSFSFGNILKTIMDPVFDDSGKKYVENIPIESNVESTVINITSDKNETDVLESQNAELDRELNKTDKKMKFKCISRNMTLENVTNEVKIINNTRLLQILNFDKNDTLSDCVLVMFYAPWCRFCAKVAPSFNALAKAFPDLDIVAVDAAHFSNLNARFGTVSVPNILLFHQSRAVVRYNQTDRQFENLVSFVQNHTGMEPDSTVNVTVEDYLGPLPSIPSDDSDYLLWMSWLFVIIFISVVFVTSSYGQHYINKVKILWQEHQHIE